MYCGHPLEINTKVVEALLWNMLMVAHHDLIEKALDKGYEELQSLFDKFEIIQKVFLDPPAIEGSKIPLEIPLPCFSHDHP